MRESADDEVSASDRIYQEFPLLRPYREYFGQLEKSDVLGEGTAGLVVRARKEGMVAKIARTAKARLNLEREMDDHEYIFSVYRR